jgi:rubrerythrin
MVAGYVPVHPARAELTLRPPFQMEWLEGEHERSFLGGVARTRGKTVLPVVTYRCRQCGYLESYANANDGES